MSRTLRLVVARGSRFDGNCAALAMSGLPAPPLDATGLPTLVSWECFTRNPILISRNRIPIANESAQLASGSQAPPVEQSQLESQLESPLESHWDCTATRPPWAASMEMACPSLACPSIAMQCPSLACPSLACPSLDMDCPSLACPSGVRNARGGSKSQGPHPMQGASNRMLQLVDEVMHTIAYLWKSTVVGLACRILEPHKRRRRPRNSPTIDDTTACLRKMQEILEWEQETMSLLDCTTRAAIATSLVLQFCAIHLEPLFRANRISLATVLGFSFRYVAMLDLDTRDGFSYLEQTQRRQLASQLRAILVDLVVCLERMGVRVTSLMSCAELCEQTILNAIGYGIEEWTREDVILEKVLRQGFLLG